MNTKKWVVLVVFVATLGFAGGYVYGVSTVDEIVDKRIDQARELAMKKANDAQARYTATRDKLKAKVDALVEAEKSNALIEKIKSVKKAVGLHE